jgi:hypothetical protein
MVKTQSEHADELRHDLHGATVGTIHTTPMLVCDYCDAAIDTTDPVMYEAIRVADMPNLEKLLDPAEEWVLDTARCPDCEIDHLDPATDGYDEALLLLGVTEADGILSVDSSMLTVADLSPDGEGYYPPLIEAQTLVGTDDLGYARWLRMKAHIEQMRTSSVASQEAVETLEAIIRGSEDIPPGIDL